MAVIKARINGRRNVAQFFTNIIGTTPDVEIVHTDEDGINVEISGPSERSIRSLVGTGAKVGTPVHFRQGPKRSDTEPDGQSGEGVENNIAERSRIMDVQGGTLSIADLSRKPNR